MVMIGTIFEITTLPPTNFKYSILLKIIFLSISNISVLANTRTVIHLLNRFMQASHNKIYVGVQFDLSLLQKNDQKSLYIEEMETVWIISKAMLKVIFLHACKLRINALLFIHFIDSTMRWMEIHIDSKLHDCNYCNCCNQ